MLYTMLHPIINQLVKKVNVPSFTGGNKQLARSWAWGSVEGVQGRHCGGQDLWLNPP